MKLGNQSQTLRAWLFLMGTLFFEFALTCYFAATIIGIIDLFRGQKEPSPIVV
jgi:hypothetical protein